MPIMYKNACYDAGLMPNATKYIRVVTWNVNSVRLRINALARIVELLKPDILCLQETKVEDKLFPYKEFNAWGFDHIAVRGEKSYNGVATLSRLPIIESSHINFCGKKDCRHLAVNIDIHSKNSTSKNHSDGKILTVHNLYVPAGGYVADPILNEKFQHKLNFVEEIANHFANTNAQQKNAANNPCLLLGDLNIAPLPNDVWAHEKMLRVVSHTEEEVSRFNHAQESGGWCDVMRVIYPPSDKLYSWWSYRQPYAKGYGRRLDHIWADATLAPLLKSVEVLKETRQWERPSDHVPVCAEFILPLSSG